MLYGQKYFKLALFNLLTFVVASSVISCTGSRTEDCSGISRHTYCLDAYKRSENIELAPKKDKEETKTKTGVKRGRTVKKSSTKSKVRKTKSVTNKNKRTRKSTTDMSPSSGKNKVETITKFVESDSLGLVRDMEPQIDLSQLKLKVDKNGCYIVNVHIRRGATNRVLGVGRKRLYIEILAPEYEEALNAEISRFLSKLLRVSRRSVTLKKGVGTNIKKFVIPKTAILHSSALKKVVSMLDLQRKKPAEC